jgi:hypothetical protein
MFLALLLAEKKYVGYYFLENPRTKRRVSAIQDCYTRFYCSKEIDSGTHRVTENSVGMGG